MYGILYTYIIKVCVEVSGLFHTTGTGMYVLCTVLEEQNPLILKPSSEYYIILYINFYRCLCHKISILFINNSLPCTMSSGSLSVLSQRFGRFDLGSEES